jgi:uncharacterized protein YprB with RNaseH-like and TPR domain
MSTLSEKLEALGVRIGARQLPLPRPRTRRGIEHVLPGRFCLTPFGETFVLETVFEAGYRHGCAPLDIAAPRQLVSRWAHDERIATCNPAELLFIDIETTGLARGTGTYAFLVGVGRSTPEGFRLVQVFLRDPVEEAAQLATLSEYVQPVGALVTFNGKAFDIPILNARQITNGYEPLCSSVPHLDLLPLARRLWRARLESRALGSLETNILGASRTEEDVPGWLIPQMYFDYLRTGDARPLKGVFYHNAMDVIAMAALLNHMAQMIDDPFAFSIEHGLDWIATARLYEDLGEWEMAARLYERGLEHELEENAFRQAVERLAALQRRRGEITSATKWWLSAAGTGNIHAHVELAKYYEHDARDYAQARDWTVRALAIVQGANSPVGLRREWSGPLEHRLKRLEKRLQKAEGTRFAKTAKGRESREM